MNGIRAHLNKAQESSLGPSQLVVKAGSFDANQEESRPRRRTRQHPRLRPPSFRSRET